MTDDSPNPPARPRDDAELRRRARLLWTTAFLMAFCSVSYELLIATEFSHILSEGIFGYPASLSVFILFMGLGSLLWYREGESFLGLLKLSPGWLVPIEAALACVGLLTVIGIDFQLWDSHLLTMSPTVAALGLSAVVGFLSGQELPILFRCASDLGLDGRRVRTMIFFDYLASLAASLVFLLVLFPRIGLLKTSFVIGSLNVVALGLVVFGIGVREPGLRRLGRVALAGFALLFTVIGVSAERVERYVLHRAMASPQDVLLAKKYTPYQRVAVYGGRVDGEPMEESRTRILEHPEDYHVYAYLNWAIQFDNYAGRPADSYHRDLMDAFVELMPSLKKGLILGGGDGLPARQLVKYDQVEEITMVDLDEDWVTFTRTNPYMRLVCNDSLNHPKVELHFGDAFKWVMRCDEKFDGIFIDFPEDTNIAAVRTISLQFLNDLKRILNPGGVIVIQDDDPVSLRAGSSAYNTALDVGLYPLYGLNVIEGYGLMTIQLACFEDEEMRTEFAERYYTEYLKDPDRQEEFQTYGFVQYAAPEQIDADARRISFYDPVVLRWSLEDI